MSPRKSILKELNRLHDSGGSEQFTPVKSLPGYDRDNPKFTAAVNGLLQDRLVNGRKGEDGGMAVALNATKLRDIRREMRGWYASPLLWVALVVVAALAAFGVVGLPG